MLNYFRTGYSTAMRRDGGEFAKCDHSGTHSGSAAFSLNSSIRDGILEIEYSRQVAGLMHEAEDDRRVRRRVVNQKIGKAAEGPEPISLGCQLQTYASELRPRLQSAGGGHRGREQSLGG